MKADYHPVQDNREVERMLEGTYHGVLTMSTGGEPYGVPLNHAYQSGKFYFHCAPEGKKLDCIRENPKVCYVVGRHWGSPEDFKQDMKCHGRWESVIAHGRAVIIEDRERLREAFSVFMAYYGNPDYEPKESGYDETRSIVLYVERMTARREYDQYRTEFWTWEPEEDI
jgi:nitroimidazol reductase NimA-like FMN-containing flavoprotein (pyridoxamine 5'-phosphate oxidase superfamily)